MTITSKFNPGDLIWFYHKGKAVSAKVTSVESSTDSKSTEIKYWILKNESMIESEFVKEHLAFESKDALKDSL